MIITETVSSPVLTSIASLPSRFKIKASAKAFKILSGFYSEPILAIPRELGANAWDSHVKAGNTGKMFEVHAPNHLEPWFSVRDFGTGLSPEDVDTIYTTYFESTKTHENDSDGCMGLGSKTPFNYTDNFNVTSFFDGKKYVYNCFIDESGAPNIMHVITEDTTEHNGLEVKFGVKIADISMWTDKITRAYEPFRFRPTIKGANIVYVDRKYIYQGKNWGFRKTEGYNSRQSYAFMGNYCYPIATTALRSAIYAMKKDVPYSIEIALNSGGFDFFFDIGELEVAPNKEQLQYEDTNSTSTAIINATQKAIVELKELALKSVEKPATRWEAMSLYNKYNGYSSPFANVRGIIGDITVHFNGEKISVAAENVTSVHKASGAVPPTPITSSTTLAVAQQTMFPTFSLFTLEGIGAKFRKSGTYYAPTKEGVKYIVFYTNKESIKKARIRHYLRTNHSDSHPLCYVVTDLSDQCKTLEAHRKYFGWPPTVLKDIESLPKPPTTPREKKVAGTDEIYYADVEEFVTPARRYSYNPTVRWNKKSEVFNGAGTYYYVDFYYTDEVWGGKSVSSHISSAVKLFVDSKLNNGEKIIYGINKKNQDLLKTGKWVNIFDEVKKVVVANRAKYEDELYQIELKSEFDRFVNVHSKLTRNPEIITHIKNKKTKDLFQLFMKVYAEVINHRVDIPFYTLFGIVAKQHTTSSFDTKEFSRLLTEKYLGIFELVDNYTSNAKAIWAIINFIDEKS